MTGDSSLQTGRFKQFNLLLLFAGVTTGFFFTGVEGVLFFVSCLFLWLYFTGALVVSGGRFVLPWTPFSFLLSLLLLFLVLSLLWTPVSGYTQSMLWRQSSLLLVFVALVLSVDEVQWKQLRLLLMLLALVALIAAGLQYFFGQQPRATFLNKNSFAGFLLPLIFWSMAANRRSMTGTMAMVLLLCSGFVLGLIGSRGVFLAVGVGGLAVLILSAAAQVKWIYWGKQVMPLLLGFITSLFVTGLDLGRGLGRLGSLTDPWSAGADRFVIWQSSWGMLKDIPWYGIGSGIYALAYPPYRDAADRSAGHFVHNDLLQLMIENGWHAGVVALALVAAFVILILRGVRCRSLADGPHLELIALSGGMVAIGFHSMFTFNFYVYSSLILVGIVLARIHYLLPASAATTRVIDLRQRGRIWRHVPVLVALLPLLLLTTGTLSQIATQKALVAVENENNENVFRYLAQAKRLWPVNDFNWYMEAEVIRSNLAAADQLADEDYQQLLDYAAELYQRTMELNPLRASAPHKYGNLLAVEPDSLARSSVGKIIALYRQALLIDPGYYPARTDLARLYAQQGEIKSAHDVLEDGLNYFFRRVPDSIPYLEMTQQFRLMAGNQEGADQLKEEIEQIKTTWQSRMDSKS